MNNLINIVEEESKYSKDKSKKHGEVFTPTDLILDMLMSLPKESYQDPSKTFFDPCAGKGNFPAVIVTMLMKGLKKHFPNKEKRYKHIVENMLYMAEFQRESAEFIYDTFSINGEYEINLYVGDTLKMPEDFFDLSHKERKKRYPDNVI